VRRSALVLLSVLAGCDCGRSEPLRVPSPPESATRPGLPNEVATHPRAAEVVHLELDDLPEPFASSSARRGPTVIAPPDDAVLGVPEGFRVQVFASDIADARWLALAPDGRVLVAASRSERIVWLRDADGDGVAEARGDFLDDDNDPDIPFGMAFLGGSFYAGFQDEVRRYDFRSGQERVEGEGETVVELPGGGYNQHWTRNVIVAPDGEHLFVSIGSATNADPERLPRASVQILDPRTGVMRTFASGLRNPVGLGIEPASRVLYTTVNERDDLGDDLVPDFLARLEEGAFYGWPYVYLAPNLDEPRLRERPPIANETRTPEVLFQAHSATLGLAFYDRTAFPERYHGGAFVAFRGSWNRAAGVGYAIGFVPFEGGRPLGSYELFLTGFLIDPTGPTTWGRPVGVLVAPDGSLLFTEEGNGVVYRVSYSG
jgi:glucose/arabinose dehydrogenase